MAGKKQGRTVSSAGHPVKKQKQAKADGWALRKSNIAHFEGFQPPRVDVLGLQGALQKTLAGQSGIDRDPIKSEACQPSYR
jgi:hypothetical protein